MRSSVAVRVPLFHVDVAQMVEQSLVVRNDNFSAGDVRVVFTRIVISSQCRASFPPENSFFNSNIIFSSKKSLYIVRGLNSTEKVWHGVIISRVGRFRGKHFDEIHTANCDIRNSCLNKTEIIVSPVRGRGSRQSCIARSGTSDIILSRCSPRPRRAG